MIVEVKETTYKGFKIELVENKGWKIILGDEAYLSPTSKQHSPQLMNFTVM